MQNKNEFNNIRKGLPSAEKPVAHIQGVLIVIHFVIGFTLLIAFIMAGFLVRGLDGSFLFSGLSRSAKELIYFIDIIIETSVYTAFLALIVGIIQGFIFKSKIKYRKSIFSLLSIAGGICGGIVGGFIYYLELLFLVDIGISSVTMNFGSFIWAIAGLIMGGASGTIVGSVNSILQNIVMNNSKHAWKWFFYNLISWSVILGIGWAINLGFYHIYSFPFIGDAIASMFNLVMHGVGIVAFLAFSPQIEFY